MSAMARRMAILWVALSALFLTNPMTPHANGDDAGFGERFGQVRKAAAFLPAAAVTVVNHHGGKRAAAIRHHDGRRHVAVAVGKANVGAGLSLGKRARSNEQNGSSQRS